MQTKLKLIFLKVLLASCIGLSPVMAHAYLGPGLGAGTISVVLGVLASIFLAVFAIVWYPFKRWRNKRKAQQKKTDEKA